MHLLFVFALCVQAVLGDQPSEAAEGENIDSSVSIPEPLEDSRRKVHAALQLEIDQLNQNTTEVKETYEILKKRCDVEYQEYLKTYNDLLANIHDEDELEQEEKEYERTYFKYEELSHLLEEVYKATNLLKIKKQILVDDIHSTTNHRDVYMECESYATIIGFHPEDVAQFGQRSQHLKDRATILYERKKIGLEIKRDQVAYTNVEERGRLKYLAGTCRRQIVLVRKLIENLRKYPALGQRIQQLKDELEEMKNKIVDIEEKLSKAHEEFLKLVEEVKTSQLEYDAMINEINCFYTVSQWRADTYVASIEKGLSRVINVE